MNLINPTPKNLLILFTFVGLGTFGFKTYLETYVKPKNQIVSTMNGEPQAVEVLSAQYQRFLNGQVKIQMLPFGLGTMMVERIVFNQDIRSVAPENYLQGEPEEVVKRGGNRVYFEISIHNNLMTELFVLGSRFIIKTTDGEQVETTGFQKSPSGHIAAGLIKKGWIAFNFKRGQVPEVLEYSMDGEPFLRFEYLNKLSIFGGNEFNSVFTDTFCPAPLVTVLGSDRENKKVFANCGEYQKVGKFTSKGSSQTWSFANASEK